ncbi:hypothetical protein [Sphingomonas spermidinifaciens]|uniref:hypothetical protein n=1 Tax=Sphingomonas spermidinifaciens TaxID=1141889 RepID=UPI00159699EC|nr:hypothetical protein [Sphingomonas spermidinifaciens]
MEPQDRNYYLTRAEQERAVANRCTDVTARRVHEELAGRYVELAELARAVPPSPRAA